MEKKTSNLEPNNGDGQQSPAGEPADGLQLPDKRYTARPSNGKIAMAEPNLSLHRNRSMVRPKPLKIVETEGQQSFTGDQESIRNTFGTADQDMAARLMLDVNLASPSSPLEPYEKCNGVLAAMHGIAPRDPVEGVISVQLLTLHEHAIDAFHNASTPGQPDHIVDAHTNRGIKLIRTFRELVETLDKRRCSGMQSVIVEEVHVHGGAQAVVGAVSPQRKATVSEEDNEESR